MTTSSSKAVAEERLILIEGEIGEKTATDVVARLLYFDYLDGKAPIRLMIDSPGGAYFAGRAIMDTMDNHLKAPVHTCCTGQASGMALSLVAHGSKGHRTARYGTKFRFTPMWTSVTGAEEARKLEMDRQHMLNWLARDTMRDNAELRKAMDDQRSLTAEEAVAFGIIDSVEQLPKASQPRR